MVPFNKFYGKIWVSFCLSTRKRFSLEVLFWSQQKEHRFFQKMVPGIFKITLLLRERHVFIWQSLETLNVFNTLTLKEVFSKTRKFFKKLELLLLWTSLIQSNKIENVTCPCKTALLEASVKTVEFLHYFIFWKFHFSLRISYKELIWSTNYPNVHIHTFRKRWNLFDGGFSFWVSLAYSRSLEQEMAYFFALYLFYKVYIMPLAI